MANVHPREKISAFVVSYNRQRTIRTCLKALSFVDELILIDKSSTDATVDIAHELTDTIYIIPWSPAVEESRNFAEQQCTHDWIIFLDDDECLSPECIAFFAEELQHPRAEIYAVPLKHYIMGIHDSNAYYWPEHQIRCYHRGSLKFGTTVHGGIVSLSPNLYQIPIETGVAIHHLSHENAARWIEKTNRYTSHPDRVRMIDTSDDLLAFAHASIDVWTARSRGAAPGSYVASAALLRATYDIIDRLKTWEEENGIDGAANFHACCASLEQEYEKISLLRPRLAPASIIVSPGVEGFCGRSRKEVELGSSSPVEETLAKTSAVETLTRSNQALASIVTTLRFEHAQKDAQIAQSQGDLALARNNMKELSTHLRRLDDDIAKKSAEITEYLYHLGRINASGWWRLGLFLDKLIRAPGALVTSRVGKRQVTTAETKVKPSAAPAPEAITLPFANADPDVSVVILSYGQVDYTLRCLNSIAEHPPLSSVEIVVSDDCSGAGDLDKLTVIPNLTFLQPEENLGFLKHANWAVGQTKGKYVLLLNNDTELKPGAIDALLETARTTPNVGLVGSKLVYPDGRLQEAGGIVWNDASAWNYGHLDNPDRPEYNYVREVDYISGASILVPRAVWDRLGGFDEIFVPAYYEDTDLAFRLRQSGLRVIYQPESVVVHYEGVSHGTDINLGVKAHQVANQTRMKERWLPTLQADHYRNGEHVIRARDRSKNRRVMLMIDHYVPQPDRDAGSRNMVEVIKSLQADGWIIKFWPEDLCYDLFYTPKLQRMGIETIYEPWAPSFDAWISAYGDDIDLVFLSRPTVAPHFIKSIRQIIPDTPTIFYGHDLHSARMRMQSRVTNDAKLAIEADSMETIERQIWNAVDLVLYPSQEEADEVKRLEPGVEARALVPFCFDEFRSLRSPPESSAILFVAGFAHPPNIDAALWLAREILPLVRRDVPRVTLWIVGSNPTSAVKNLANDFIDVTGYVTDYELASKYLEARVAVVPLRIGAGIKLKVVEALHEGLPLVTTQVGAQGLEGLREAATVVDDAAELARELVRLLRDDVSWVEQAERQLDYARVHFSRRASIAAMVDATSAAIASAERRGRVAVRHPV